MSDAAAPVPVKGSGQASNSQKLLLAILATVLVVVMLVFLLPTLLGGDDGGEATTPVTQAPVTGTPSPAAPSSDDEVPEAEPVSRPGRSPFTPAPGF
jgi:hypothetical protein